MAGRKTLELFAAVLGMIERFKSLSSFSKGIRNNSNLKFRMIQNFSLNSYFDTLQH